MGVPVPLLFVSIFLGDFDVSQSAGQTFSPHLLSQHRILLFGECNLGLSGQGLEGVAKCQPDAAAHAINKLPLPRGSHYPTVPIGRLLVLVDVREYRVFGALCECAAMGTSIVLLSLLHLGTATRLLSSTRATTRTCMVEICNYLPSIFSMLRRLLCLILLGHSGGALSIWGG